MKEVRNFWQYLADSHKYLSSNENNCTEIQQIREMVKKLDNLMRFFIFLCFIKFQFNFSHFSSTLFFKNFSSQLEWKKSKWFLVPQLWFHCQTCLIHGSFSYDQINQSLDWRIWYKNSWYWQSKIIFLNQVLIDIFSTKTLDIVDSQTLFL